MFVFSAKIEEKRKREAEKRSIEEEQVRIVLSNLSWKQISTSPSFVFHMWRYFYMHFICLYSCPIQCVPAELARSAGKITRLEQVTTDYAVAQCWLGVSAHRLCLF